MRNNPGPTSRDSGSAAHRGPQDTSGAWAIEFSGTNPEPAAGSGWPSSSRAGSEQNKKPRITGAFVKRLKGLEPSTFCMASRRSSQLSYSRAWREYSPGADLLPRSEPGDMLPAPRTEEPMKRALVLIVLAACAAFPAAARWPRRSSGAIPAPAPPQNPFLGRDAEQQHPRRHVDDRRVRATAGRPGKALITGVGAAAAVAVLGDDVRHPRPHRHGLPVDGRAAGAARASIRPRWPCSAPTRCPQAPAAAGHGRRTRTSRAAATSSSTATTGSGARRRPTICSCSRRAPTGLS